MTFKKLTTRNEGYTYFGVNVQKKDIFVSIKLAKVFKSKNWNHVDVEYDTKSQVIKLIKTKESDTSYPVRWCGIPAKIHSVMAGGRYLVDKDLTTGKLIVLNKRV